MASHNLNLELTDRHVPTRRDGTCRMYNMNVTAAMECKPALRRVVKDCSERGLYVASKWSVRVYSVRTRPMSLTHRSRAAELLLSYPKPPSSGSFSHRPPLDTVSMPGSPTGDESMQTTLLSDVGPSSMYDSSMDDGSSARDAYEETPMTEEEEDLFMIARAHYDAKEHERVDYLLRYCKHPKARFLGLYCRFLVSVHPLHAVLYQFLWSVGKREEGK